MFSLMSGFIHYLFSRPEYFVLVIGLDNAGKTCLLEKLKTMNNPKYKPQPPEKLTPTIGLNVGELNKSGIKMVFWDLGGQLELQCLWEKYYREVHALVYVVDATAPDRLRDSKDAFDSMVDSHLANNLPVLVLVNKCDVDGAMSISEVKEVFNESAPKLGVRDCKVMQASAITGENVEVAVVWLQRAVQRNNHHRPPNISDY
eukprot:m.302164 g.302164  ORF g.302164 m.302164 type:complete len:202 (+) comp27289_c0_seq3:561-1166(+)